MHEPTAPLPGGCVDIIGGSRRPDGPRRSSSSVGAADLESSVASGRHVVAHRPIVAGRRSADAA
jgi:hypothetical protein